MKHLKTFENLNTPQVGDYVIVMEHTLAHPLEIGFYENNIGRIVDIKLYPHLKDSFDHLNWDYWIKFDDDAPGLFSTGYFIDGIRPFYRKEIIFFSPDKEVCEAYINAKKYNL